MPLPPLLQRIISFFLPRAHSIEARPCTEGNINQTWILRYSEGRAERKAVLQRINPAVFPEPATVMANFRIISRHLAEHCQDASLPVFPLPCRNPDGADAFLDEDGGLWRLMSYIGPSRTLTHLHSGQVAAVGAMLARFHLLLAALTAETIQDPLPGFHDTSAYLARFDAIGAGHSPGNEAERFCLAQIEQLRPLATLLQTEDDKHGRQLVHADPKCSNFLFAADSDTVLSLIDLDTVRPGLLLHDLGDCLRSCCSSGDEDSPDPAFDIHGCIALIAAYMANGGKTLLTQADKALLPEAVRLLLFELGLRFFTDYLEGNPYFNSRYPEHNLHRAVAQFQLHASLMAQEHTLKQELAAILS